MSFARHMSCRWRSTNDRYPFLNSSSTSWRRNCGMGKQASAKDVVRFIRMAIGSCDETRIWLKYAVDLGYIEAEEYGRFHDSYCEVGRMLTGLLKRWSAKI